MPNETVRSCGKCKVGAAVLLAALMANSASGAAKPMDKLPEIRELLDPFVMNDGSKVRTREDWEKRRGEIRELILQYEYGRIPTEPTTVKAVENGSEPEPQGHGIVKHLSLSMGPGGKVTTPLVLTLPQGQGPFAVIVKGDLCWGRVKPEIVGQIVSRGYALAEFDRTQIAPDKNDRTTGVFPLYPDHDWGGLAAWAWGFGRVIDYLVTRPDIDRNKIIVTGHSRGGKAALLAGALDERVALTVPNGSGAGGAGCFRIQWPMSEDLKAITEHFPYWFARILAILSARWSGCRSISTNSKRWSRRGRCSAPIRWTIYGPIRWERRSAFSPAGKYSAFLAQRRRPA